MPKPSEVDPNEIHPVQTKSPTDRTPGQVRAAITLRAYEVYEHIHGAQEALIDLKGRGCRGGFSTGELVAFLYARSFPKTEWRDKAREAFHDLKGL